MNSDNFMWIANHFCKRATHEIDCVTGLQLSEVQLMNRNFNPTTTVLASILLCEYSATTYDAILITIEG